MNFSLACVPACLILATLATSAGCGGAGYKHAVVSGQATLDGQPIDKGYVTFSPQSQGQGPVTGGPITNGSYRVDKVPLGKVSATFQLEGPLITLRDAVTGEDRQVPTSVNLAPEFAAGVALEVAAGNTNHNFELRTAGP